MKGLVLTAPWGQLVSLGQKRIETRSFPTKHRGPLAIASAKGFPRDFGSICHSQPFERVLAAGGYDEMECFQADAGKIICVVDLVDCLPYDYNSELDPGEDLFENYPELDTPQERAFGYYDAPGRYGWVTKDVRRMAKPIPILGRQRVFNVPVVYCDGCDGTGLQEGWNRRDGHPCPKCWGDALMLETA